MNNSKGEWKVIEHPFVRVVSDGGGDGVRVGVANCYDSDFLYRPKMIEAKANAYLIAASPSMYEALKYVLTMHASEYSMLDRGIGIATEHGKIMLAARQALAKAEGK